MDIIENHELKRRFLEKLQEEYGGSRDDIHVSDLVYCLREAYFRKTKPLALTERQLGFFVDGARRHEALQGLLDVKCEVPVERFGVKGHIDVLLDGPVEIKTTRSLNSLPDHYFKQLGFYAVILGVNHGYLVVQRLHGNSPWEFYKVVWPEDEVKALEAELEMKARLLKSALEREDPSLLPYVDDFMTWKCNSCLYREICERI